MQTALAQGGPSPGVWHNTAQVVNHLAPGLCNILASLTGAEVNAQMVRFGTINQMLQRGDEGDNSVLVISDSCLSLGKNSKGRPRKPQEEFETYLVNRGFSLTHGGIIIMHGGKTHGLADILLTKIADKKNGDKILCEESETTRITCRLVLERL